MNQENIKKAAIVDMSPHYVADVPWLIGRPNGEHLAKLPLDQNGLGDAEGGIMFRMIIPSGKGVNKSFFEGFLLKFSIRTLKQDKNLILSELVSIDPSSPNQACERYHQTKKNFDAALLSLSDFWNNQDISAIQLEDA